MYADRAGVIPDELFGRMFVRLQKDARRNSVYRAPVAVIPGAGSTDRERLQSSRALCSFANLSEEQQETKLSIMIYRQFHGIKPHPEYERGYIENARKLLSAIFGRASK